MERGSVKIGVYVLKRNQKTAYKKECYNVRLNAGMEVVCDVLRRAGFTNIDYCSEVNAHRFDIVMYSVTSDCDLWNFVAERVRWGKGNFKVVIGGQGVLNPRPLFGLVDYFVLGRAEGVQAELVECIMEGSSCEHKSVVSARDFSLERNYYINQTERQYPYEIQLPNGKTFKEGAIGCNHKCFFCGYTWQRRHTGGIYRVCSTGIWSGGVDEERAMLDIVNLSDDDILRLRTTAIDGFSQRLRFMVNKRITREVIQNVLTRCASREKCQQLKVYNIVGYPTETEDEWFEFLDDVAIADSRAPKKSGIQHQLCLHSTPFRPMPATPLACAPMSYTNYRGRIARVLSRGKYGKTNIFFKGGALFAFESMGTESLPTVFQSAIWWRGTEADTDNIVKIATSRKFLAADSMVRLATLEHYFDVPRFFGAYTPDTLPTRNIRTYAQVEKLWGQFSENNKNDNVKAG